MMQREDVIDLLSIVQSVDNRDVGENDVQMWLAVLHPYTPDDCADAVLAHRRERPGVWLEPGHIVQRVRAKAQDRYQRTDPTDIARLRYEAICDAKAGYPVSGIDDADGGRPVTIDTVEHKARIKAHNARLQRIIDTEFDDSPEDQKAADIYRRLLAARTTTAEQSTTADEQLAQEVGMSTLGQALDEEDMF